MNFWTEEEFNSVIQTIDQNKPRDYFAYVMLNFLFYTGVRFSEMQALTWNDLDLDNKTIQIERDLHYKKQDEWKFDALKNISSKRSIALDNSTFNILCTWKDKQKEFFLPDETSFIFTYTGYPITKNCPNYIISKYSKLANVHRIKPHALRHSHASFLIQLGVNIIAIAKRLGHADVQEVLRTYGHLYPQYQFDVATNINDHMKEKRGQNVVI